MSEELEPPVEAPSATANPILKLFNDVRSRLVETGTRNRLVHVNRANTRGNVLNIVNEKSDEVFRLLFAGKSLKFRALGRDKFEAGSDEIHFTEAKDDVSEDRYTDNILETHLGPDGLQKKLLKIHRDARTAEEESGVNLLYLALGFLSWFEDANSTLAREAPLALVPVELVRNAKTSTFDLKMREDEFPTNLPLQQRLKGDFGIELPDLEVGDNWKPSDYFAQVRDAVSGQDRWNIDHDALQLGFFSFSKLLMYRDLDSRSWPEGILTDHELTKGLLYEGFESDPPLFEADTKLDEILSPEEIFHVVDADASQAMVIEEVRRGRNLVVQGPPGTGKSQTITNIIAAAVKDGKRVLFVAEKMAALSVVHDRLVKVGLRDVCLELHSRSANKKSVLAELASTLNNGRAVPAHPTPPVELRELRDRLNSLTREMHCPIGASGETGFSVLGVQSRFLGMGATPPQFDGVTLIELPKDALDRLIDDVRAYAQLAVGDAQERNPFEGCRNLTLQPVDLTRLKTDLEDASTRCRGLASAMEDVIMPLAANLPVTAGSVEMLDDLLERIQGLPTNGEHLARSILGAPDLDRLCSDLDAGFGWHQARTIGAATFVDHAFDARIASLRAPLVEGVSSLFARWKGSYRRASKELAGLLRSSLPKKPDVRVSLIDQLLDIDSRKRSWNEDREYLAKYLGDSWRGEQSDFEHAANTARWLSRLRATSISFDLDRAIEMASDPDRLRVLREATLSNRTPALSSVRLVTEFLQYYPEDTGSSAQSNVLLRDLATTFSAMSREMNRYADWSTISRLRDRLAEAGVADVTRRIDAGSLNDSTAAIEIEFGRAEALWKMAIGRSEALRDLALEKRHDLVAEFARLERIRLKDSVKSILFQHLSQLPQGAMGEMRVIRGEIGKRRSHIALRRLFQSAGTAIQRIKPVLLMSPISVAQFLPPGTINFDLLLIDEASQVRPEDALGAIARAAQIVVVGDKKQLPPTSFFDRLMNEEDEGQAPEEEDDSPLEGAAKLGSLESVLTLCEARGLSSRMLSWHYRSRDPSLIRVSNREFYDDGLILPPSPTQHDPAYGLSFTRVPGVYDRGGKRDNRIEGEAIIARVTEHSRNHPDESLGIATFSFAQRNLLTELLELARRSDPLLDEFLREGKSEDVFVKNIENVQGDERDVILISVGYGPSSPGGKLSSMSFGPVNSEGGERRLNVLFTRARIRCEVFASFDPGDIDLTRTRGEGPRVLKRFLEFAKTGELHEHVSTGLEADTPFEMDVAEVVRSLGYLADPQVGSAGFRIDLGVRHCDHPGRYIMAIECDGATYHGALWARERDRLRQDVLEGLGWRFHRIWSTDWFYQRVQEIDRLRTALAAAANAIDNSHLRGSNTQPKAGHWPSPPTEFEVIEAPVRTMPTYRRASPSRRHGEPHDASLGTLAYISQEIIRDEGPIHFEEIARRVATCFGKEKAGGRIISRVKQALRSLNRENGFISNGAFWFTLDQAANPPVRDRSAESGATLKAASLSPLELRAAIQIAREDNAGGSDEELIRTAARLLGFRRVGPDLRVRIGLGLDPG